MDSSDTTRPTQHIGIGTSSMLHACNVRRTGCPKMQDLTLTDQEKCKAWHCRTWQWRSFWSIVVRLCNLVRYCQTLQCQVLHFQHPQIYSKCTMFSSYVPVSLQRWNDPSPACVPLHV